MQTQQINTRKKLINTDFETASLDETDVPSKKENIGSYIKYILFGIVFGIILVKSEVISWYRIQEMFRLQSFHMYGIIGSAVVVGIISVWLIKKFKVKTIHGEPISLPQKPYHKGVIYGGIIFGLGWALTGACPGPLFALAGAGYSVMIIALLSAVAGTYVYGLIRKKLPHIDE